MASKSKKNTIFGFPIWMVVVAVAIGAFALAPQQKIAGEIVGGVVCSSGIDVDLVIVTDLSSSMSLPADNPPLAGAKIAVNTMIENIFSKRNNQRVGLVAYSTSTLTQHTYQLTDYTRKDTLKNSVNSYSATGQTCISCGIQSAIDVLNNAAPTPIPPKKVIVLMTDGGANRCIGGQSCTTTTAHNEAVAKAKEAVAKGYTVHVVGYTSQADTANLKTLAIAGNGFYYQAESTNIVQVYDEVAETVCKDTTPPVPVVCTSDSCYTRTRNEATNTCTETFVGQCKPNDIVSCTTPDGFLGKKSCTGVCQWNLCQKTGTCIVGTQEKCGDCGIKICDSSGNWGICQEVQNSCATGYKCILK